MPQSYEYFILPRDLTPSSELDKQQTTAFKFCCCFAPNLPFRKQVTGRLQSIILHPCFTSWQARMSTAILGLFACLMNIFLKLFIVFCIWGLFVFFQTGLKHEFLFSLFSTLHEKQFRWYTKCYLGHVRRFVSTSAHINRHCCQNELFLMTMKIPILFCITFVSQPFLSRRWNYSFSSQQTGFVW